MSIKFFNSSLLLRKSGIILGNVEFYGIEECKVLITADNADPVEATLKFNIEKKEIKIVK
jgi:hypothetical protein